MLNHRLEGLRFVPDPYPSTLTNGKRHWAATG